MKKLQLTFIFLFFLLSLSAQNKPIGHWDIYTSFSVAPEKVIETPSVVYFTAGQSLFSYDKKNQESYTWNLGNKLNDLNVTDIFYNADGKYMLVAYESGNIDLVYDNGTVANMSDLKDASTNSVFKINAVAFDGDNIYVTTESGIVQFNEPRHEVVQSGRFNTPFHAVGVLGDKLIVFFNEAFHYIDKKSNFNSIDKFKLFFNYDPSHEILPVSDNQFLVRTIPGNNFLSLLTVNPETMTIGGLHVVHPPHNRYQDYLIQGSDGTVYYVADNILYTLDFNYREKKVCPLPEDAAFNGVFSTLSGASSVWSLTKDGLGNHSVDPATNSITLLKDRYRPENLSVKNIADFVPSYDGTRLYVQSLGSTSYRFGMKTPEERGGRDKKQNASVIDLTDGDVEDVTLSWLNDGNTEYAYAVTGIAPSAKEDGVYFVSSAVGGVYKVDRGELVGRYDDTNSPFELFDNRFISYGVSVDRAGNLWVYRYSEGKKFSAVMILPADKAVLDPSQVKKSDWYEPDLPSLGYESGQDAIFLHCKKSNMVYIVETNSKMMLLACDTKGTFNDFTDDVWTLVERFVDQDGKTLENDIIGRIASIVEDLNGRVWVATLEGMIEIPNPKNVQSPEMKVTRIKIPRNDGTNLADYLATGEYVYSMSVDAANRKWLGTEKSGLYLVSPSGNEIIERFTVDNSPLPSNMIQAVYADKNSSMIYIGINGAMLTYSTDAAPAMPDYSDIYAYPNPVRPDYQGDIYVRGLMDNSLVKIADSAGNVVFQGRSEGGLFSWNGRDSSGSRVKSGVYYVFVSNSGDGESKGAVTKIMIVN